MPNNDDKKVKLITLYSYKGGVGRTMAVANAACQLANKHGKDVICIDWDLEAPGLHHYFGYSDKDLADRDGLLDYLLDFGKQVGQGSEGKEPDLCNYLVELKPEHASKIRFGSVRLMHCGRTDENYMARVQAFDWDRFYREQQGWAIIETLKLRLREAADIVLIDARAGQADVGTTPTIQVPEGVVLLFTSNRQSLTGTEAIARSLHNHPDRLTHGLDNPALLLVPSRVFGQHPEFRRWIKKKAGPVFDRLLADGIVNRLDQPDGLNHCVLMIDPNYAFDEQLVVLDDSPIKSDLRRSYEELAQAITNLHEGRHAWSAARTSVASYTRSEEAAKPPADVQSELEELRRQREQAAKRRDTAAVALLSFQIGRLAIEAGRYEEAAASLEASLSLNRQAGNLQAEGVVLHEQGRLAAAQNRLDEAWSLYEQAFRLKEQAGDARGQGVTLHEMGSVRAKQARWDEAWSLYEQALRIEEEAGEARGQGITLHEMGNVRTKQERWDEAWSLYEQALRIDEEAGDARGQGITLHEMGSVRAKQTRWDEAWSLYEQALGLLKQAGDARGQGITLHEMGNVRAKQERWDEAWSLYEQALRLKEQAGDARERSITLHAMGNVRAEQERWDEAWSLYERALGIDQQAGDARGQGITLHSMGVMKRTQGDTAAAGEFFSRGLAKAQEAHDEEGIRVHTEALKWLMIEPPAASTSSHP